MYNINRQQASSILNLSTRSIDRYIKSGKIRIKKEWKTILLNDDDVKNLNSNTKPVQDVISSMDVVSKKELVSSSGSDLVKKDDYDKILKTFENIYSTFRSEIKEKDEKIEELSIKLWKALEQNNNKIDVMEYKKTQFLAEQSNKEFSKKLERELSEKQMLVGKLKYEKTTNKLMIIFICVFFVVFLSVLFFDFI